jgi:OOP family OmpA-OmpF porin
MRFAPRAAVLLSLFVLSAGGPATSSAQGIAGALRKKAEEAKKKIDDEAAKKTAVDSARKRPDSVKTAAPAATTPTQPGAPQGSPTSGTGVAPTKGASTIWENYDFVPGSRILFYTDFSEDRVGNFARGLKYLTGSIEIVDRDGVKVLRSTSPSELLIPLGGKKLPQRFTIEVDVITPTTNIGGPDLLAFEGGPAMDRGLKSAEIMWNVKDQGIAGGGTDIGRSQKHLPDEEIVPFVGQLTHIRILMDSNYFKMYANERRLYNIPELAFKRDTVVRLKVRGGENADATFVTSIRVAESELDVMYDALNAKGRWVTQGILFATGKAEIQPESRPVLKEIASTMKQHADLKILIEGHTDNVGSAASNLTLSDARAAAVKAALVSDFGLGAGRITTKGLGDTKPAAPNTTALGRAQNRRVEIVKQ